MVAKSNTPVKMEDEGPVEISGQLTRRKQFQNNKLMKEIQKGSKVPITSVVSPQDKSS